MKFCAFNFYAWNVFADRQGADVHVGGEEVQHVLLTRYLAGEGIETTSIVGDFSQPRELVKADVRILASYEEKAGLAGAKFFYPRLFKLWSSLVTANADVYYTSCAGPWVGVIALFCKLNRRQFTYRVASDSDCDPKRLLVSGLRDRVLYEYGLKRANKVLAQTETQRAMLVQNYRVQSSIAKMFVDAPKNIRGFSERETDVFWLANFRPLKRPLWFVDLAKRMPTLRFGMAGGPYIGAQSLFNEAEKTASEMSNLAFHGQVPFGKTSELLGHCRVFVNTSELEGFPNTYLQAWANGLPIVATFDPDGIIEREGLGIFAGTVEELALGIRQILSSEKVWTEYSQRCRDYMRRNYSNNIVAADYF